MPQADKGRTSYRAYTAVCLKKDVKANAVPATPADATAVCNDGTFSKSKPPKADARSIKALPRCLTWHPTQTRTTRATSTIAVTAL
jgi:hypothetical protein